MAGNEIIALGILLMAGFAGGKASYAARLPSVTGYILAGLLLGPSLLDIITPETIEKLEFINSLALSLIAISVGGKLDLAELSGGFGTILSVSLMQTLFVGAGTFAALVVSGVSPALALLLAATALATAPAAVMAVVEETRAQGPFTNTLLAVVALSNVLAVMVFGFAMAAVPFVELDTGFSLALTRAPMASLGGSLLLGAGIGLILSRVAPMARNRQEILIIILGTAFLSSELARIGLKYSPLLINITIGFVLVNLCPLKDRLFEAIGSVELPIYITFFSLQGAHLDIRVLGGLGLVGVTYILSRMAAKVMGAWLGAAVTGAAGPMRRFLGPALFPQAGIAIGMCVAVSNTPSCSAYAPTVTTVVLAAVLINELIGPVAVNISLNRVGEARPRVVRKTAKRNTGDEKR
ncbi:MAG: cation:proton antiporter [bacterium]|nr:cation:proton antiporter [bacterium]MDT8396410.1 cation:proton antiporter [bacterium]